MATWRQEFFGPELDAYALFDRRPSPIGPPLPPVTPVAAPSAPPLAPLPPIAQSISQSISQPAQAAQAGSNRGEQAARLAQDIAYGRSDWERAGQAILGSGRFEDASGLRRAGAVAGGVALGTLALASWIPGFNVFKPAQAARAARAFGQGAAEGARAGSGVLRTGWDTAADLEATRRAQRAAQANPERLARMSPEQRLRETGVIEPGVSYANVDADVFRRINPDEYFKITSVRHVPEGAQWDWLKTISAPLPKFNTTISSVDHQAARRFVDSRSAAPFRSRIGADLNQGPIRRANLARETSFNPNRVESRQMQLMTGENVSNMGDSLAHWQYVGNKNIQSVLRTGQIDLPHGNKNFDDLFRLIVRQKGSREAAEEYFEQNARQAIRYLDEFIAGSTRHGGFEGYRGVPYEVFQSQILDKVPRNMQTWDNLVGFRFSDPGYSALSVASDRASGFAAGRDRNLGVLFRVLVPDGTPAGSVSGSIDSFGSVWPHREYEMLLGRGTRYEIVAVEPRYRSNEIDYDTIAALITLRIIP